MLNRNFPASANATNETEADWDFPVAHSAIHAAAGAWNGSLGSILFHRCKASLENNHKTATSTYHSIMHEVSLRKKQSKTTYLHHVSHMHSLLKLSLFVQAWATYKLLKGFLQRGLTSTCAI
jgi:hypothetical protein